MIRQKVKASVHPVEKKKGCRGTKPYIREKQAMEILIKDGKKINELEVDKLSTIHWNLTLQKIVPGSSVSRAKKRVIEMLNELKSEGKLTGKQSAIEVRDMLLKKIKQRAKLLSPGKESKK